MLILLILLDMPSLVQSTHNNRFANSLQYVKKEVKDEVDFFVQINIKVFYKLILSYLISVARLTSKSQSNKYAGCKME